MLEIWEALDNIKTCFFKPDELIFGFTSKQKDKYLLLLIQNLKKMMEQIWKTATKNILKQLQDEDLILSKKVMNKVQA